MLGGRHVPAAGYDHVVDPAGDEEITLRIKISGVAGEIPAVMQCTDIGVGAPPIALECPSLAPSAIIWLCLPISHPNVVPMETAEPGD
jgi:hypothetical protein